jgi:hypothetical protein
MSTGQIRPGRQTLAVAFSETDLPAIYHATDKVSVVAQRRVLRALKASLAGIVVAAGFGAVSIDAASVDWAGVIASAALLVATACTAWLLWAKPEQKWYDARAASESLKTLAWQYAVGGGEFAKGSESGDSVRTQFLQRLVEMLEGLERLKPPPEQDESQLTPALNALRESSLKERRLAYLDGRVRDQRSWYTGKAHWNERRRIGWTVTTIVLLAAGLVSGLAKAFFELDIDLLGPTAAAAGAAMAWARSKDYAELAEAYAVTAQELSLIEAEIEAVADEGGWASFVERAERAISREHTLWKARRGKPRMGL